MKTKITRFIAILLIVIPPILSACSTTSSTPENQTSNQQEQDSGTTQDSSTTETEESESTTTPSTSGQNPTTPSTPTVISVDEIPIMGDWIITEDNILKNEAVTLNGNLVVMSGASLTLNNVDLVINCKYDGEFGISIKSGASMWIYNSNITSPNPLARWYMDEEIPYWAPDYLNTGVTQEQSPRFSFVVRDASSLEMHESRLCGCGWGELYTGYDSDNIGLVIDNTKNVVFKHNTFSSNHISIRLKNTSGAVIQDNIFSDDEASVQTTNCNSIDISGNTFNTSNTPIYLSFSRYCTVTSNTFLLFNEAAVWTVSGDHHTIENNTILGRGWAGIAIGTGCFISNNNIIRNNHISGDHYQGLSIYQSSGNQVESNIIEDVNNGIYLGYASGNTLIGNLVLNSGWQEADCGENGIQLFHSNNNTIAYNTISSTRKGYGLITHGLSNENIIFGNNFLNNIYDAYNDGDNQWFWQGIGNYWSNYKEEDNNNDDIIDTPKTIKPFGLDEYPSNKQFNSILTYPEHIEAEEVPQLGGSTIVNSEVQWSNDTILLSSGRLDIQDGGSLTLNNVTLLMPRGAEGIHVHPGGSMSIYDSRIIPTEDGGGFLFHVLRGSSFILVDSELRGCGITVGGEWAGLTIFSTDAIIENNLISDSYTGIVVIIFTSNIEDTSIYIRNNIMSNCYYGIWGIPIDESVKGHIEGNDYQNCFYYVEGY